MKPIPVLIAAALCVVQGSAILATAQDKTSSVEGNYMEVRSCDVYTGRCFANGEMGLAGKEAIMAWNVTEGRWNGVDLGGLAVIAVVKAQATLGDRNGSPYPAKSVLIIDEKADTAQRAALADLARTLGGALVEDVVGTEIAPIEAAFAECGKDACARVKAGNLVDLEARCLNNGDLVCGNEKAFYPPLASVDNPVPHYTERDRFAGAGLGVTWDDSGRRSAYLATFAAQSGD